MWLTKTLALLCGFINVYFGRDDSPKLDKEVVEVCVTKVLRGRREEVGERHWDREKTRKGGTEVEGRMEREHSTGVQLPLCCGSLTCGRW